MATAVAPSEVSDLEKLLAGDELEPLTRPLSKSVESEWANLPAMMTSPEAEAKGRNFSRQTQLSKARLYTSNGDSRLVSREDVVMLLGEGLFERCPLCRTKPNNGVHDAPYDDPNECPARPRIKGMRCPICEDHGRVATVWEDRMIKRDAPSTVNTDLIAAPERTAKTREKALELKWQQHLRAFHAAEAEVQYGLVRKVAA